MKNITLLLSIMISFAAFAQKAAYMPVSFVPAQRTCGTMESDSIVRANDPSMGTLEDFEIALQQVINNLQHQRSMMMPPPYDIPMIVHVIHNGEAVGSGLNLSQAQIYSQYDVLNEDYNNTNADGSLVPAAFQPLRGSLQMNFKKALRNPSGVTLAEPGINRINRNTNGWTAPPYSQTYMNSTIKPATIWDPTKYFNVWVTNLSGGLLGYAQFPPQPTPPITGLPAAGAANTDGVVVLYTAFGRVGTLNAPYNKGRTLTHEAGHFFGLRHIWGDESACAQDDYVNDTPQQKDMNYGCPSYPQTTQAGGRCLTSDPSSMFMNYMDYTDDACMYMFSQDQATRMEAVITSSPRRVELTTSNTATPLVSLDASISSVTSPDGSSCASSFIPVVTLTNNGSTTITSATITYNIDGSGSTVYNWTGSLAGGLSATVTLASASATVGSHTFNVTVTSPNGGTDGNAANNSYAQPFTIIAPPSTTSLPLVEGFTGTTFPPTGWTLLNPDANNTWSRVTNAGGFGNSTNSAKMDNYSGSVNIAGQTDDLLTPALNLSNANSSLKMTFSVAYARYSASYSDSLFIEVTTDCGSSWTKVYRNGGTNLATAPNVTSDFTPTTTQWRKDSIMLGAYAGLANAQFRFRSYSGYGNNIYLDDINLNFSGAVPVADFTASATTVCAGSTITYTDLTTNSPTQWSWSFPGGTPSTSTSQNPTVVYNTAGTYNAVLTATNGSGSNTMTKTSYITVNALPSTVAAANPSSICPGSSAILVASGAMTYSWGPATGLSATTGSTVTATPTSTITYTVTGTGSNTCKKTSTVSLVVNPPAAVSVTPSSTSICTGGSTSLVVSGATTATWSPASGLSSTSGTTVTASPTATTTYTVTGTNASGCTATATAVVSVSSSLSVSISPSTVNLCAGTSTQLTASGATTYTWSPTTGLSATTGATVTAGPSVTITYTVTGSSGSCSSTATRIVKINANPVISTTGSTSICAGSSATLNASGAGTSGTYSWSPSATLSSSTGNQVTATPTSTTTYTVTGTNTNGCKGTSTAVVTVNPLPTTVAAGTTTICAGSSTTLNATGANTYSWSPAGSLNMSTGTTVVATPASTTTYTITGTSTSGCVKTATAVVSVNPVPVVQAGTGNPTICAGSSTILSATGASVYTWSPSATLSSSTGSTVTATPTTTTTYTVTGTANGCSSINVIAVTVNPLPAITVSPSSYTVCNGGSVTLSATGAGTSGTYQWQPGSTTGSFVVVNPATTTTYTVTGTTVNGCSNSASAVVTVSQNPTIAATAQSSSICSGSSTTLLVTGASTYTWSPSATLSSSTGSSVTATPTATTTYTVTGTTAGGCIGQTTLTVGVTPMPTAGALATPDSTSVGTAVSFTNTSMNGTSYSWDFGDATSSTLANPTHTYGAAGTYTVVLTASNGACSSTATVLVEVTSPNGINAKEELSVNHYPNPTSGTINLEFGSVKPEFLVITDVLGNVVLHRDGKSQAGILTLDLSHLAKGIYFARLQAKGSSTILRIILE